MKQISSNCNDQCLSNLIYLSQYALLILSITYRYATSPRRMVELISSPESNSFISHSFVEFVELSLSPDLCRFDSLVDEWFALSRVFFFDGSKFSRQNVRLIVLSSSRLVCSPSPEEFVLSIESLRHLNSPDGIRIVR